MKQLERLLREDIENLLLDELEGKTCSNKLYLESINRQFTTISNLQTTLKESQSLTKSTKERLDHYIKQSREIEDLYNELKILYNADVKNDILAYQKTCDPEAVQKFINEVIEIDRVKDYETQVMFGATCDYKSIERNRLVNGAVKKLFKALAI